MDTNPHHTTSLPEKALSMQDLTADDAQLAAQGYKPELERQLTFWTSFSMAICSAGAWLGLAAALSVGIQQGGPGAVVYGFIFVFILFMLFGASVSDLVSAMPTAAGPYYWMYRAAPPKWARLLSWYTGYLNIAMQIFGASSAALATSEMVFAFVKILDRDLDGKRWQTFIIYEGMLLLTLVTSVLGNRYFKYLTLLGGALIGCGFIICTITIPSTAPSHQPSKFVWAEWVNYTGWSSNGLVFFIGLPNGFFAFGLLDTVVHMTEEIKHPERAIPRVIFSQFTFNFATGLVFLVAILYSIQDLNGILDPVTGFPFFELLVQALPKAGAAALAMITVLTGTTAVCEAQVIASRLVWSFARDGALPFSAFFAKVNPRFGAPVASVFLVLIIEMLLGILYLVAEEAFSALVGSTLAMHNVVFGAVFITMVLTQRKRVKPGPWHMKGTIGLVVYSVSAAFMAFTTVIFCLPYTMPTSVKSFNWSSLLLVGSIFLITVLWFAWGRRNFQGPPQALDGLVPASQHTDGENEEVANVSSGFKAE